MIQRHIHLIFNIVMKSCIITFYVLFLLSGCAVMEQEEINCNEPPRALLRVKSADEETEEESRRQLSLLQSSKHYLMSNQIACKNNYYYLRISKEEAAELGVPSEMYDFYSEYAKNLNEQ